MHILVAAHDFYPDAGSGGTGRYVYETSRELVDRGHTVSVITRRRGESPATERIDGIDVYRYDLSVAGESAFSVGRQLPDAVRTVERAVEAATVSRSVDVLSFQGPLTSLLVHRAVDDDVPRILTFHSPWPTEYAIKTRDDTTLSSVRRRVNVELRKVAERRVVEAADHTLVLSNFMKRKLAAVYGHTSATVIPGRVDVERFSPAVEESPAVEADGTSFLTVRRLSERMGHDVLIDAFARLTSEFPDAELFIAGDGPLRDDLERQVAEAGVTADVTFLGYVPDAELPGVYAGADVFVLPTVELEGFGLATMEALAAGTPAVGTAVGGTVDVLGEFDATSSLPADPLVPHAAPAPLCESLTTWASLDDDALQAASVAAREYACRHTWSSVVDRVETEYAAACTAHRQKANVSVSRSH